MRKWWITTVELIGTVQCYCVMNALMHYRLYDAVKQPSAYNFGISNAPSVKDAIDVDDDKLLETDRTNELHDSTECICIPDNTNEQ